jgi:hypothetical protein
MSFLHSNLNGSTASNRPYPAGAASRDWGFGRLEEQQQCLSFIAPKESGP